MKVKVKFDLQSIKNFVIEHGEKMALVVVGIVFAMFLFSAAKRETLDAGKQPERLAEKANQVRTHVQQSAWDPKHATEEGLAIVDFAGRAKREPVVPSDYVVPHVLNTPIADPKTKREDPAVYPVEELIADSGFGVFAVLSGDPVAGARPAAAARDDGKEHEHKKFASRTGSAAPPGYKPKNSAKLKPQPWAVITGVVPWTKQVQEFSRVFDNAQGADKDRDTPTYIGYIVERSEIDPAHPDAVKWQELKPDGKFQSQWENTLKEVVSEQFVDRALTAELGPLVSSNWGSAVVHPKVPAAVVRGRSTGAAAPAAVEPKKEEKKADAPAANEPVSRFGRARAPALAPGEVSVADVAKTSGAASGPAVAEYRLLRVFDFDVRPTKKYRYRVKVALSNPNYGLSKKLLKNPPPTALDYIETEWSEPTQVVTIPDRFGVLAKGIAGQSRGSDPTATIMVTAIDEAEGLEGAAEVDVQRGAVANLVRDRVEAVDPRDDAIRDLRDMDLHTDRMIVDIRGGKPLSKKSSSALTSPLEVLVLDKQGNLKVCNEFDDQPLVDARKPEVASGSSDKSDPIPAPKRGPSRR